MSDVRFLAKAMSALKGQVRVSGSSYLDSEGRAWEGHSLRSTPSAYLSGDHTVSGPDHSAVGPERDAQMPVGMLSWTRTLSCS